MLASKGMHSVSDKPEEGQPPQEVCVGVGEGAVSAVRGREPRRGSGEASFLLNRGNTSRFSPLADGGRVCWLP